MIGRLLDRRYRVCKLLGKGGFGHTYLAEDTKRPGHPPCVVKHLKPQTRDPEFLQIARRLFASEAEALEKLGDLDQIPRLFAYFEEEQEFYLVQEFIDGHPLSQELEEPGKTGKTWEESQVIDFLQDILSILVAVHSKGVIHRDIKPENVMRRKSDRRLVLLDFGAVKQVVQGDGASKLTVTIGTSGYIPAEQAQGKPRFASDIYAVGMMGIQALTGVPPSHFGENSEGEVQWHMCVDTNFVTPHLIEILDRMVRRDYRDRYASAAQVLEALQVSTLAIAPPAPLPPPQKSVNPPPFRIGRGALFLSLFVATLSTFAIGWFFTRNAQKPVACSATRFTDVREVPSGVFNYGGSTSWAAIRSKIVESPLLETFPDFRIRYTDPTPDEGEPGSHTGIQMLLNNRLSFAESSRPLRNQEKESAQKKGYSLEQRLVAVDPSVFAVHPSLTIPGLTRDQIKDIYTGKLRNWKELGGPDQSITPYAHPSARTGWFSSYILQGAKHHDRVVFVKDTPEALRRIATDRGGIYDASASQVLGNCDVRPLAVSDRSLSTLVAPYIGELTFGAGCSRQPNSDAFSNLTYPFYRDFYVIYKDYPGTENLDELAGVAYSNLLLTDAGQQLIANAGFIPVRAPKTCS